MPIILKAFMGVCLVCSNPLLAKEPATHVATNTWEGSLFMAEASLAEMSRNKFAEQAQMRRKVADRVNTSMKATDALRREVANLAYHLAFKSSNHVAGY